MDAHCTLGDQAGPRLEQADRHCPLRPVQDDDGLGHGGMQAGKRCGLDLG